MFAGHQHSCAPGSSNGSQNIAPAVMRTDEALEPDYHGRASLERAEECRLFKRGLCTWGVRCHRKHVAPKSNPLATPQTANSSNEFTGAASLIVPVTQSCSTIPHQEVRQLINIR
ncbi:hypothetical protein K474DRAFT_672969 [Panus rudis PR-1116 ss-1]|nr:hypothetical protein K474DRAFT_769703 [Panus rudis PR-1116 ss-1]KAI0071109.1 hypothetical protein K474DRAFT_672969 [Panus rudis PR-1116 ss-1]